MKCPICGRYHRPLGDAYVVVCQECWERTFADDVNKEDKAKAATAAGGDDE